MRKIIIAILTWLFLLPQLVIPQQTGGSSGSEVGEMGDLGTLGYLTQNIFSRKLNHVCFTLWVATRGTTDSLTVVIQTNPSFPNAASDTTLSAWRTLSNFGGVKVATGYTTVCFPTGTPARDSVLELNRWVRVLYRHSADTTINTDTASWFLYINEDGNPIH